MSDKRKVVYDVLKNKTGYKDSFEDFNKIMDGDERARAKVYSVLKDKTGYSDSIEDFDKYMGIGEISSPSLQGEGVSSPIFKEDVNPANVSANKEGDNKNTVSPSSRFVQGKGKDTTVFGVPYNIYTQMKPETQSYYYQKALDDEKRDLARSVNKQADELQVQAEGAYDKKYNKLEAEEQQFREEHPFLSFIKDMANAGRPVPISPTMEDKDRELRTLQGVVESARTAKQTIDEAGKKGNTTFLNGLGRGMRDMAGRGSTWDMGALDLNRNSAVSIAANKYLKGEDLDDTEKLLLRSVAIEHVANNEFAGEFGRGYKMGQTTVQSLPFMAEFLLNPLSGSGKAIGKGMLRQGLKVIGKELPVGMLGKVANGATRVLGDVTAATGMALTTGSVHTGSDFIDRQNGVVDYGVDEGGNIQYSGHKEGVGVGEAAYKAIASKTIENVSEMAGGYFSLIGKGAGSLAGKVMEKSSLLNRIGKTVSTSKVADLYRNMSSSQLAKTVTDFERSTGYHGTIEEYGEEVVGTVLNAIFTGDQSFGDLVDKDKQIDTFLGVCGIGGLFSISKTVGYRTPLHQANRELGRIGKLLSHSMNDEWGGVSQALQDASVEDRKQYLENIMKRDDISAETKKGLFQYVGTLTRRDAIKSGKVKQVSEGEEQAENVITDDEVEDSYQRGYDAINPQDKNDAKIALEGTIERIAKSYPDNVSVTEEDIISTIEGYGNTPAEVLMYMSNKENGEFSEEYVSQVTDYLNAKAQFDGIIDNVRDGMEGEVESQIDYITKNTHMDGSLYNVSMKVDDRSVYVTGGNIVVGEDGIIDHKSSDKSIVIRDAQTGKIEMVDARDIFSLKSGVNAEQYKNQMAEQIRQAYAQRAADEINGVLPFNINDSYTIFNPQTGSREEVKVLQVEDDLVSVVGADGKEVQTTKDEIQTLVDRERVLRYQELSQQNNSFENAEKKVLDDGRVVSATSITGNEVAFDVFDQGGSIIDSDVMPRNEYDVLRSFENESEAELGDDGLPVMGEEGSISSEDPIVLSNEQAAEANGTNINGGQVPVGISQEAEAVPGQTEGYQEATGNDVSTDEGLAGSAIPIDDKGELLYHKAPVELTIADLNDGNLTSEEVDALIAANKEESAKQLKKISGRPPKIGANKAKYLEEKRKWADTVAEINSRVAYWNEVETQMQVTREQPGDAMADEIKAMGEPMSGEELAAMMLGAGKLPLLHGEYKRETGFGNMDAKKMFGLFASKEKGGMTIEQAGEQLMLADLEAGTNFFDQNDPNAGRNTIIDVLSSSRTRGGLINYIKNNREVMAERERQAVMEADELAKEQWYQDNYHMTPEEYEVYEENSIPLIEEKYKGFDEEVFYGNIADELKQRENDTQREITGTIESDAVLQGEESISSGRTGSSEGGQRSTVQAGLQGGNENGVVSEGASAGEIDEIVSRMQDAAEAAPVLELTPENWSKEFGDDGRVATPIGDVKMGENQYLKLLKNKRENQFGMIKPTLVNPDVVIEQFDPKEDVERESKYLFVKCFVDEHGGKHINFESVTVNREGKEIVISNHIIRDRQLRKKIEEGKLLWNRFEVDSNSSGENQDLSSPVTVDPNNMEPVSNSQSNLFSSENKDSELSVNKQAKEGKSSFVAPEHVEGESVFDYAGRVDSARVLHEQERKVETNPTDAQKEAGNYKKGHVKVDGLDITIENPRGSERSGVDADGKPWSVTMNNTYGYIRGTEGVDGDHIDLFLGNSGDNVFVVDQVKEDGSFDEHKVMYGFSTMDEAKEAYLANYSLGWKGLGSITGVSKDMFKKWIDSSHRKTKPFAEYKILQAHPDVEFDKSIEGMPNVVKGEYHPKDNNPILYTHSGELPLSEGDFCHVERVFTESNSFQFTGKEKIESADDVAYIFRELENSSVENSFVVLVKDKKPTIVHLGMGSFIATIANIAAIKAAYKAVGAESLYFVHNHPSGNLKCSNQDVGLLKGITDMFDSENVVVQDGIIINTTSGQYGTFDLKGIGEVTKSPDNQEEFPLRLYAFDKLVFSKDYNPSNLSQIKQSMDVASLVSSQRLGERTKVSYMILDNSNHVLGNLHTTFSSVKENESALSDEITQNVIRYGGTLAVVYGNFDMTEFNPGSLNRQIKKMSGGTVQLLDCVSIDGMNSRSAVDDFLMEPENTYTSGEKNKTLRFRDMKTYHGSGASFDRFDISHSGEGQGERMIGKGVYTTKSKRIAKNYAGVAQNKDNNANGHIYEVNIPKDTGKNYLDYDKVYSVNEMSEIADRLRDTGVDINDAFDKYFHGEKASGNSIYRVLSVSMPKGVEVNEALSNAGYVGYKYSTRHDLNGDKGLFPKKSYVVFDESRATIVGHKQIGSEVEELSEKLHTPVRMVNNIEELPDGVAKNAIELGRNVKGWYDVHTGEVVVYMPSVSSVNDAVKTILHEVVGHKGLRQLFGERSYDEMMMNLYGQLPADIRKDVATTAVRDYKGDVSVAMDEYLAEQAEKDEAPSWWNRAVAAMRGLLRKIGIDVTLSEDDVRYLLWRSRKNLEDSSPFAVAEDVAVRYKLGIGEHSRTKEQVKVDYNRVLDEVAQFAEKYAGAARTFVIRSREMLRGQLEAIGVLEEDIERYERWMDEGNTPAFYSSKYGDIIIVLDTNVLKEQLNSYLWHENTHYALSVLEDKSDVIDVVYDFVKKNIPDTYNDVISIYKEENEEILKEECVAFFIEDILGTGKENEMASGNVRIKDQRVNNAVCKILNIINNGTENEKSKDGYGYIRGSRDWNDSRKRSSGMEMWDSNGNVEQPEEKKKDKEGLRTERGEKEKINERGGRLLRQELGTDASLRNDEVPNSNEETSGSARDDAGGIRRENNERGENEIRFRLGETSGEENGRPTLLDAYKKRILEQNARIASLERKLDSYVSSEELSNEVIEEIKKEIGSDIISEIGKGELNSLLLQVKNAKTKKSLEKIFMNVKRIALAAQSRKLQREMDKLLALKVQDVNGKNMSIAKNVDDSTRRIFSFIRGKLSDIKKSGLEDDVLYLKRDNRKHQEEIKRLERVVQEAKDVQAEDEALAGIEDHRKVIEENKERIGELREEKSEIEKVIAGASDVDVEKEMAALDEKMDRAAQGEAVWTQGDSERMAALNIISGQIMNKSHDFEIQSIELDIQQRLLNNSNLYKDRMKEPSENKRRQITNAINENRRQVVALERLINDTRSMQVKQLQMTIEQLEELISNGKNSLLQRTEEEIKRKSEIIGRAIRTVEGKPIDIYDKKSGEESAFKKFFSAPLGSFEYMCKRVNTKTLGKDGFLYNYFVEGKDGVMKSYDTYVLGMRELRDRLDEKSKEVFGKKYAKMWTLSDKVVEKSGVHLCDTKLGSSGYGVKYEKPLSKGQAMYVYQVWKMNDGRTKLEMQGFDEESIAEIRDFIGDDYIKFADWMQEELLPELREKYNAKYIEMYGTSLAEIKDYVPLRIVKKSTRQESDLSEDKGRRQTLEERAGSLINRVVNTKPVDITMSAFDVLFEHGRQMEEWNAYARVRRDLDAVLSNGTFRNQLDANFRGSFGNFYDAAAVATKAYHPDQNKFMDEVLGKLSKGIVGGNIAWRLSTALKQVLSAPAFWGYSQSPRYIKALVTNTAQMPITFKWCMENIPSFRERVTQGTAGNEKLEEKSISKYLDKYIETGMIPNKLVDAITCSIGAKSIFDYRYGQLIKQGLIEVEARNQALMDADIYYNQTQQSSHPAFLSPMQMSRSIMDRMITTYQNSNIGYVRKVLTAYYDLTRSLKWKELLKNYTDMYITEGMSEEEAGRKAYRRLLNENKKMAFEAILFGWGLNLLWNVGSQGLLGFFAGGDDDDDNDLAKGISFFLTSPIKGMPGGNLLESIASGYGMNPILVYDELDKFMKETKFAIEEYGLVSPEILFATLEKVSRYGGVDLEVLGNIYLGVEGLARDGAMEDDKMIDFLYILNSPKSSRAAVAKELYKDESITSFAEKVARANKYISKRDSWENWVPGAKELTKRRKNDIEKEFNRLHMTEEQKNVDDEKKIADRHRRKLREMEEDPFEFAEYVDSHQEEHKMYQKYY